MRVCVCVCVLTMFLCVCEGDAVMCVFVHIPVLTHNETGEAGGEVGEVGDGNINSQKE